MIIKKLWVSEMLIRSATTNDAQQLQPLLEQLGYSQSIPNIQVNLQNYCNSDDYAVFVVEKEDKIVGMIAIAMSRLFVKNVRRCRLEGFVVDQSYRRLGIAKALLKHVENYAWSKNCILIELTSGMRRAVTGAHAFYEAQGYSNDGERAKKYLRKELI
jgi:GNAT superfamily N-acetyltransferase